MFEKQASSLRQQEVEKASNMETGLRLLSPTFQQSIQTSTSKMSSSESIGWSTTPPTHNTSLESSAEGQDAVKMDNFNPIEFDFDRFTLASVHGKETKKEEDPIDSLFNPNFRDSHVNSIDRTPQSNDSWRPYYDERLSYKPNPLSSSMGSVMTTTTSEDFDMSRRQRCQSLNKHTQLATRPSEEYANEGSFHLSSTAALAGFPLAKRKEMTAVVMRGWLQRRKGLVLKRWKSYYCLFKSDDSLCLYASEDTVNGRLEQRYQVLRVVITDKNDSFHIIGVDSEGAPRREEFRASISSEWSHWFQVLGKFFDKASMIQARACKPELTFATSLNETEEDEWLDNMSEVDPVINAVLSDQINCKSYDEGFSSICQRKQTAVAIHDLVDGRRDAETSTPSSLSGLLAPSINAYNQANGETKTLRVKPGHPIISDCPMIEHRSQRTFPILETHAPELEPRDLTTPSPSSFWSM